MKGNWDWGWFGSGGVGGGAVLVEIGNTAQQLRAKVLLLSLMGFIVKSLK